MTPHRQQPGHLRINKHFSRLELKNGCEQTMFFVEYIQVGRSYTVQKNRGSLASWVDPGERRERFYPPAGAMVEPGGN